MGLVGAEDPVPGPCQGGTLLSFAKIQESPGTCYHAFVGNSKLNINPYQSQVKALSSVLPSEKPKSSGGRFPSCFQGAWAENPPSLSHVVSLFSSSALRTCVSNVRDVRRKSLGGVVTHRITRTVTRLRCQHQVVQQSHNCQSPEKSEMPSVSRSHANCMLS